MTDNEREQAIKEGKRNAASEAYFELRQHDLGARGSRLFGAGFDRGWDAGRAPLLARIAELEAKLAQRVPDGWKLVPDWKGYALLGTGHYVINHTADFDEKLGAELLITLANEDDKSGNRQIGESREVTDQKLIESDQMVIRIGFLNERGLFALEDQLRYIRKIHFSAAPASPEQQDIPPEMAEVLNKTIWELYADGAAPEQQDHSEQHLDMVAQAFNAQQAEPPPWWPAVENILSEYGLQAFDFVADFKAAQQAEAQEPATMVHQFRTARCSDWYDGFPDHEDGGGPYETRTLFTHPQPAQRQPLTIAEVEAIIARWSYELHGDRARFIVRETELAHGIGEKK